MAKKINVTTGKVAEKEMRQMEREAKKGSVKKTISKKKAR